MRAKSNYYDKQSAVNAKEDINGHFSQLCWNCKKARDCSCSWSAMLKPVKGWDAVPINNEGEHRVSYAIFGCPLFEAIKEGKVKQCQYCGKEFVSYGFSGNTMCSYDCYKAYEKKRAEERSQFADEFSGRIGSLLGKCYG